MAYYIAQKLNNLKLNNYISYKYHSVISSWSLNSWRDFPLLTDTMKHVFQKDKSDMVLTGLYTQCVRCLVLTQSTYKTRTY